MLCRARWCHSKSSVRLSVTLRYDFDIGWNSSKIISRPNSLRRVDWKCRTWKWQTVKIAGHEIAGHEISGPICRTWNCRTWKWRTKNDARARAWNGMLNLYSVYCASNVRRLYALLCPAISFLYFHVLQFHVLHFHVLHFQSVIFMSCNFMSCTLVRQFHVLQFHALQICPSISRPSFSRPAFSAPPLRPMRSVMPNMGDLVQREHPQN